MGKDELLPSFLDAVVQAAQAVVYSATGIPAIIAAGFIQTVGVAFSNADIVLPDSLNENGEDGRNGRGIVVHEYGHFALCSLLYDKVGPSMLPHYLQARINAGATIEGSDGVSVVSDAFADFVAGQVVGGVNYPEPSGTREGLAMNYCSVAEPIPEDNDGDIAEHIQSMNVLDCMEGNATGLPGSGLFEIHNSNNAATAEGFDELARVGTTWLDAFDGHYTVGWKRANVPGNVDYYNTAPNNTLVISEVGWMTVPGDRNHNGLADYDSNHDGANDDICIGTCASFVPSDDENVSLPGNAIMSWVAKWHKGMNWLTGSMQTLNATMMDYQVKWCDRCDLFALHEDGVPKPWEAVGIASNFSARWSACAGGRLAEYVGPAPDPNLNMDPATCEPCVAFHHVDALSGECVRCGNGQRVTPFGCETCPPGTVVSADGLSCSGCAGNQIAQDGQCIECAHGQGANKVANRCDPCNDDAEPIDLSDPLCTAAQIVMNASAADDVCPHLFVLPVKGVVSGGPLNTALDADARADYTADSCAADSAAFGVYDQGGNELIYLESPHGDFAPCAPTTVREQVVGVFPPQYVEREICMGQNCSWAAPSGILGPDVVRLMIDVPDSLPPALRLSGSTQGCEYAIY